MRLSELCGKEIINLFNGERLGVISNSDLIFDESSGKIISLLIPKKRTPFFVFGERAKAEVAWSAIKKIGPDIIIIDMEDYSHKKHNDFIRGKNFT
ncbi:MAG TPA: YlmC/YmxH family sporulation protein [Thermoanaerobacterales bacterium]|uniref:YlmC/YmxH family sporulation protein n=1 Tax=Tepidanaerobacter sp. GT38 TaxID=2722793 RepID=UPI0017A40ABA|nr:YlmC/YmxH family sporulation protein [Tepidanaerobacter sp. GT38]MCG1011772.1 YlmC/YmxH family sporulation protein [Tepidanaerobacter sp. GT38]HHY42267.1 YlmC/YmxH family sporulation protein [Thermoanaerobacterales bacterium]